ncbi:MAG: hypothetical protein K8R02_10000 [Anaerohalosphaeraceae bacterium]|nr:hypothetical protein [Anaerohalosphaeraceae bacterium]
MAVARQPQSNAMLYTVITFVALFLIAAILAVVFYLKSEEWRNLHQDTQAEIANLASAKELRSLPAFIGAKDRRLSYLGQTVDYLDQSYQILTGSLPAETSAEAKLLDLKAKYADLLVSAGEGMGFATDANGPGTFRIIMVYKNKLDQKKQTANQLTQQLDDLHAEYDLARKAGMEKEQELLLQIGTEQTKADSVQESYNQLRDLMDKKTTEQVQMLMAQRDEAIDEKSSTKQELLATLSKLNITQRRMQDALGKLDIIKPRPKEDVAAYKPDGNIITIETSSNIVFLNIGSKDKVYPGLTFSVYDRNAPIPTDGKGKAEIEVFDVDQNTSVARIMKSAKRNPIMEDDIIVNLIWDSRATNSFVVAGEFDFDGDGAVDSDGTTKVKQLIENWDGRVETAVTIDTDFVVLGSPPRLLSKPGYDVIESDPMAMDKYEDSLKAYDAYREVKLQAKDLYVPVFGIRRFFNFIGYESMASR